MAILASTNWFILSDTEMQRLTEQAYKDSDLQFGPQWLKKMCWYFVFPVGIVAFGLWFQNLAAGIAAFLFSWGGSAASNALYLRIYKRNKASKEGTKPEEQWQIVIDDGALIARSSAEEHRYAWNCFTDVATTVKYVFVRRTPSSRIIIPKKAFDSEAATSDFIKLIEAKIHKAA